MSRLDVLTAMQMCAAPSDTFSAGEWCEAANVLAGEVERLSDDAQLGPQTQSCDNPSCSVATFGAGYDECPRCGERGSPIRAARVSA